MAKPITYNGQTWTARALTAHDLSFDPSDGLSSLAKKYGVSAEQIADANDVEFTAKAVREWMMDAGGCVASPKGSNFSPGNVVYLPDEVGSAGAAAVQSAQAPGTSFVGVPWWAWAGAGAIGVGMFLKSRKKGGAE